jgi:hypothetical protein
MKTKDRINLLKVTSQSRPQSLLEIFDGNKITGSNLGGLSSRQMRRLATRKNKAGAYKVVAK